MAPCDAAASTSSSAWLSEVKSFHSSSREAAVATRTVTSASAASVKSETATDASTLQC